MMQKLDFGDIGEYKSEIKKIRDLSIKLRHLRPEIHTTWMEPADWVIKNANINGHPVISLTLTLTPTGCAWASKGGCTMCGEYEGSTKNNKITADFHILQFACSLSKYAFLYKPQWIRIYQEGNYLNENEVDHLAQSTMIKLASLMKGVERITIESLAKYLNKTNVSNLAKSVCDNVELEIGMGFEAENVVVRNICINKGESLSDFKKAVKLLKDNGIRSLAYVLLKPPFLTEKESIDEAIATIQLADEIGFDAISLEPASLHKYSLLHALNIKGHYQLPWLWSIIEVAKAATNIKDFRIGGTGFYPRPSQIAYNRHKDQGVDCNKTFWSAIKEYGKHRDMSVFEQLTCTCKTDWENECCSEVPRLNERINNQLKDVNIKEYENAIVGIQNNYGISSDSAKPRAGGTQYTIDGNG